MTLDEAIKHAEEVAEEKEIDIENQDPLFPNNIEECKKCAEEHRQLAKWLRELKYYKSRQNLINKSWKELINYKEGIEKIKMRNQAYREQGETALASGMEQALDILKEVNANDAESEE